MTPTTRDFIDKDPISVLIATLRAELTAHGIAHIRPQPGVLDDDGVFDIPIDIALTPFGLLPIFVEAGRLVFAEAWLDRAAGAWPFAVAPQGDAMLGLAVVVEGLTPLHASVEIGIVCVTDALCGFVERNTVADGEDAILALT